MLAQEKIDGKGISWFLALTFALTYIVEGALIASGLRFDALPVLSAQLVVAAVMWAPALATVITIRLITHEGFAITNLRFGDWRPYVVSALIMPGCFALIYGLTWLLGLGEPDWQLRQFIALVETAQPDAPPPAAPAPSVILIGLFWASVLIGPTINGVFGFGEELGWRGYLLPKLMPLGKLRAYLLVGVIWGLWHAPLILIGYNYPGYPWLGIAVMCALTTALGIYINEMALRYHSSLLAGSIHGAFNGQAYGIWRILFPETHPLLGGATGLVGIIVFLGLGLLIMALWRNESPPVGDASQ